MENEGILLHRRGYAIWITEEGNDTKERNVKRCIVYEQYAIIL